MYLVCQHNWGWLTNMCLIKSTWNLSKVILHVACWTKLCLTRQLKIWFSSQTQSYSLWKTPRSYKGIRSTLSLWCTVCTICLFYVNQFSIKGLVSWLGAWGSCNISPFDSIAYETIKIEQMISVTFLPQSFTVSHKNAAHKWYFSL